MSNSDSTSKDPIESVAKGTVKGFLEWSKSEIISIVKRYKNRDVAFVGNKEEIKKIMDLRKTPEFSNFKDYLYNREHLVLCQLGMQLRKCESNSTDAANLRKKIVSKFGFNGLYVALFIQNGLLGYVSNFLSKLYSKIDMKDKLNDYFSDIEQIIYFVNNKTDPIKSSRRIINRIDSNSPIIYIISSYSSGNNKICKTLSNKIFREIKDIYSASNYNENKRNIYIFNRKDCY